MDIRSEFEMTEKEILERLHSELQVIRKSIDESAAHITNQTASEVTARDINRVGWRILLSLEGVRNIQENQTNMIVGAIKKLTFAVLISAAIIAVAILIA